MNCKVCGLVFQNNVIPILCPLCGTKTEITDEDIIKRISSDEFFINAMFSLKEKDPVEYQLKISQFKTQLQQQDNINSQKQQSQQSREEETLPKCPTCGSHNVKKISLTSKVVGGALFGLFSSNVRKSMRCKNCGYKW